MAITDVLALLWQSTQSSRRGGRHEKGIDVGGSSLRTGHRANWRHVPRRLTLDVRFYSLTLFSLVCLLAPTTSPVGAFFYLLDCLERRRYAALVGLEASPPAALKGTQSEASAAVASLPRFRHPDDCRPRKRYVLGTKAKPSGVGERRRLCCLSGRIGGPRRFPPRRRTVSNAVS